MEIILKLKICENGKVELSHLENSGSTPKDKIIASDGFDELIKKYYTLTDVSKKLGFSSVNYFIEYLLKRGYLKRNGRKPSGHNNYYVFNHDYNSLFYQKTPCQPVYVTPYGIAFFYNKLKIKK